MTCDQAESFVSTATENAAFLRRLQVFYKTCFYIFLVKLWKENGVGSCIFGQYKITFSYSSYYLL